MSGFTPPEPAPQSSGSNAVAIGAVLVAAGVLLFIGQLANFDLSVLGWPAIVIGIGAVILLLGLFVNREEGMVVGGTVVTTVGLVLAYQNWSDHWESWAYAWALVGPAASGLGMLIWGVRTANSTALRNGMWGFLGGLGLFAVGYLFFEGVIGISGRQLPVADWVLPAVVIGIGVVILGRGLLSRGEPERS